jgi:hypothetical protein
MKPIIEVISSTEMAKIYWRRMRSGSIREVENLHRNVGNENSKKYWGEVLILLQMQMSARGGKSH